MNFPERFSNLPAYAFPRLRALLDHHTPGGDVVHMTIGEPKHAFPAWVTDVIAENTAGFNSYPPNEGTPELRQAFCDWVARRYDVTLDAETNVLPLNGSREGLYNVAMALCPESKNGQRPVVLMPNPFYQVYMLAAISVGAEPVFVSATEATGHLPDYTSLPAEVLARTVACYICSPANPQGAVADHAYWSDLIALAEQNDFQIFADECYSEIYRDTPPVGVLQVARDVGADPERVVAFHSLSKRSNLPGLRSGFVVADEAHVIENRRLYGEKYAIADEILGNLPGYRSPEAGFFLWLPVEDGEAAALSLWQATGVRVLPGAYLSQNDAAGVNPGKGYIRVALVAPKPDVERGLTAIRDHLYGAE